ncbi:MAG: hypothetical protein F4Z85_00915 [Gemmatimonadetes bacterium]|nr:hypothetical protein [Gemmatimonadota bacterium]MYB69781.1 hypothetical protein [Gemmatimonadota bacterium]
MIRHNCPVGASLVGAPPTPRASTRDAPTVYQTAAKKLFLLLLLIVHSALYAQDIVFEGTDFAAWNHPAGLVQIGSTGVAVKRFGTTFNAVANASEFSSVTIGDYGRLPVRAPSNQAQAGLVADQDHNTYWQPDLADPLQKWWLEVDLQRAVVARKIRVIFPQTEDARPFEFFSVHVSPGIQVVGTTGKHIAFERVGRPVNNNTKQVVEFELKTANKPPASGTPRGEFLVKSDSLDFSILRFVRFEAAGQTAGAALAEIEVDGVGFNLPTRVFTEERAEKGELSWGGRTWTSRARGCDGCGKASGAEFLVDADLGRRLWSIQASSGDRDWRDDGVWSVIDFGNVFRIDRIIFVPLIGGRSPWLYGYQQGAVGGWPMFDILTSDGSPSNTADPTAEGPFDYELLSEVRTSYPFNDFQFPTRDTRLILWRVIGFYGRDANALQLFAFHRAGYPKRVELESSDLDLGAARSIRRIEWDADLPPGTRLEVQTQTGNGFTEVTRYFLKNGDEVTKEAYEAARKRYRGDIVQENVRDATWSTWSQPHRFSGQSFQSPSPRRYLRTRIRLYSDDLDVSPVLRSLRVVANDPVIVAGLSGSVWPREAGLDSLTEFRYTIKPQAFNSRDPGFDQVLIALPPGSADAELIAAWVGGQQVEAHSSLRGDSLWVQLPPPVVKRDSVAIAFATRVFASPTVFETFVFNSSQEDNAQGVVPAELGADQVFVPEVVQGASLIRNLRHSELFTPNGDAVNDLYELSFTVVKTDKQPHVRVFSLDGRLIAELANATPRGARATYAWDGQRNGELVPPGIYIVHVELQTDPKDEIVQQYVHVVY